MKKGNMSSQIQPQKSSCVVEALAHSNKIQDLWDVKLSLQVAVHLNVHIMRPNGHHLHCMCVAQFL
jgi:hypothetical protein